MIILGIESTCDETGIALVKDGTTVIKNVISSSVDKFSKYGGIVPEIAAREQSKVIIPVLDSTINDINLAQVDAIAVSNGPGLLGSLLIGVETAKALAAAWNKPIIPVNHLVGHIYANWLKDENEASPLPEFPLVALIVSGGHSDLVYADKHGSFKLLGSTLDDASGEAFDKVARLIGLPYPGGPQIESITQGYQSRRIFRLPRPKISDQSFDFSFSGIKTAAVNVVNNSQITNTFKQELAYEFQEAVCDILIAKTLKAALKLNAKSVVVGGGVAANSRLREMMHDQFGDKLFFPQKEFSVDNGAMIASAAFFSGKPSDPLLISADPTLHF